MHHFFSVTCILVVFLAVLCSLPEYTNAQREDPCYQRADPGFCRASVPRFYFNSRSGRCDSFIWGGCGGNRNNFVSMGQCQSFRNYCVRRRGGR